jgi:hypothetical protein
MWFSQVRMVLHKLLFWEINLLEMILPHLVLGDNIFYGSEMGTLLKNKTNPDGGVVFAYHVSDPERYGVVEFDEILKLFLLKKNLYSQIKLCCSGYIFTITM